MADDVVVSDVYLAPHDEGLPNISDGNEDWNSAGLQMLLGQAVQSGSYARSDSELDFGGHNATNDTVDVQPGVAYLAMAGETVDVQNTLGGSSAPTYDVSITAATMPAIMVGLPTAVTVTLQDSTLSQVWLAYATDGTVTGVSAGDVYVRGDNDGATSAPPHPSVGLGSANPDDSSADTLSNRFGSPTFDSVTTDDTDIGSSDFVSTGDFISFGPTFQNRTESKSFTDTTYASDPAFHSGQLQWDTIISDQQGAVMSFLRVEPGTDESVSIRLRNVEDSENVFEVTGITSVTDIARVDNYTPTTTASRIRLRYEWKEDTGSNSTTLRRAANTIGVQL